MRPESRETQTSLNPRDSFPFFLCLYRLSALEARSRTVLKMGGQTPSRYQAGIYAPWPPVLKGFKPTGFGL